MNILRIIFANDKIRSFLLLCFGIFVAIALLTYNQADPSINLSTTSVSSNWLGVFGAIFADLLYQVFGFSSFIIPLCLISWGIKIYQNGSLSYKWLRFFAMIFSVMAFSASLGALKVSLIPANGGGVVGWFLVKYISEFKIWGEIAAMLLALLLAILAIGVTPSYFWNCFSWMKSNLSWSLSKFKFNFKSNNSGEGYYPEAEFGNFNNKISPAISGNDATFTPKRAQAPKVNKPPKEQEYRQLSLLEENPNANLLPPINLLDPKDAEKFKPQSQSELAQRANDILSVLNDFGVKGKMIDIMQGPVVTMYEFEPAAGTKSSRVIGLADDIARSLSALSTRIAIIPGRNALGIELPNQNRMFFRLRELVETQEFQNPDISLPIVLGKDLGGRPLVVDLAKMPHLLVAGTTGSGKSVAINTMIMSLLYRYTPEECKMIMIDPKMLELSAYDDIPHLLTPVVTEPGKAIVALKWAVKEMENRYRLMSHLGVRNLANYNTKIMEAVKDGVVLERKVQTGFDTETGKPTYDIVPIEMAKMPFIVVIVDEMADLMLVAGKDIEASIQRLAQMARAAGIHIIMATQRPSVDVITGVIKANFPSRISFKVTSKIDSRTILGEQGAEQLLGMGDMLYMGNSSRILRVHGPFVDDKEVERVTKFLRDNGVPKYISAVTESVEDEFDTGNISSDGEGGDDEIYKQAVNIVRTERKASISYIQRCLRIGYNRAANIVEMMEKNGILSEPNSMGKREILLPED